MVQVPLETRARIVTHIENGWSMRRVAEQFHIGKSTVSRMYKRWREEGLLTRKVGSGGKLISNEQEDNVLITEIRQNPFITLQDAIVNTGFPGSRWTGLRRIKAAGLHSYRAVNKIDLSVEQKEMRMGFALQHFANDDVWPRTIFSDEKTFQSSYNGRVNVYRPANTRYHDPYIHKVRKNPRFSINLWGWISARGLGVLWDINGHLNSIKYIEILENIMLPSVTTLYPDRNFIFLQDNCPVHKSRLVTEWLGENEIETFNFPPYSGDMNPIENVWGLMVKYIAKQNIRPRNRQDFLNSIENAWEAIPEAAIQNIIASMPTRMNNVLESNGGAIKY